MSTPTGVEENEDSRFVDYTIASEFEELQNVIEMALKGWMKSGDEEVSSDSKVIEYKQSRLVLSISTFDESYNPRSPIPVWFELEHGTRYVVLSKYRAWTSHTKSERKYLLGALVSALNSCGYHDLPVFSTASDFDTIGNSPEVDGYCITSQGEGSSGRLNPQVIHYESSQLSSIDSRHALFYADGVRQMFCHIISGKSNEGRGLGGMKCISLRVLETFEYGSRALTSGGFPDESRRQGPFLLMSDPSNDNEDRVLCASFFRKCILSRGLAGEEMPPPRAPSKIAITLLFDRTGNGESESTSDNRLFSNLAPSVLPYDSWTVEAEFRDPDVLDDQKSPNYDSRPSISRSRLSAVIRRLLGLYIFGKTAPPGLCMQDLQRERAKPGGRLEGAQKAQSIGMILSPAVRADLRELCGFVGVPIGDREAKGIEARYRTQQNEYLRMLFPGGAEGEDFEDYQKGPDKRFFFRPGYRGDEGESIPFGSWLSICSLCVGSLYGDLGDIAHFWKLCTEGFRSCYDEGIEIADIDLSYQSVNSAQGELARGPLLPSDEEEESFSQPQKRIWEHLLWSDVLRRKNSQSSADNESCARLCMGCLNRVELPDPSRILSVQKLRMMIFCAAVKDEEPVTNGLHIPLSRRLPLTSDSFAHQRAILSRLYEDGDENQEGLVLRWQVANAAMVSDIRSFKAARPDSSLEDFLEWYRLGSQEALAELWEALHPTDTPISEEEEDKHEQRRVADVIKKEIVILWEQLEGCPARDQKPIFRAETELEKSISFFETLTPMHFAAEMLCAALETSINIVVCEVCDMLGVEKGAVNGARSEAAEACSCGNERLCHKAVSRALLRDVFTLQEDVSLAVASIREDVSPMDLPGAASRRNDEAESISQSLLLTLDALCEGFDRLEEFEERVWALQSVFATAIPVAFDPHGGIRCSREMLVALAFDASPDYAGRDSYCQSCKEVPGQKQNLSAGYTCRTSAESELLWHLGRYMHSEVSKDHVWHSDDARELGHPTSKTMFLSTQPAERADRLRVDLSRRAHSARLSFVHTER
jgi:hypothetical protein